MTRHRTKLISGLLVGGVSAAIVLLTTRRKRQSPLAGRLVVITGGSRGLGLALSEACLYAGSKIAMLARDTGELERGRALLVEKGFAESAIEVFQCDVIDESESLRVIELVEQKMGPIDVLINNAGIISVGPVENQSLQSFHASMDTNFFGALNCILAVLPRMLERRSGHIVNIASIGGIIALPHLLPYSASKFALAGLSRGLAVELKSKGIHVLTVCPWLMRTGSHYQAYFSGQVSKEYRWFSIGATLPLLSVNARDAAERIVAAIENRESELLVSAWSNIASSIANNAAATTRLTLSLVNRFALPAATPEKTKAAKGFAVRQDELKLVGRAGANLAHKWNQMTTNH